MSHTKDPEGASDGSTLRSYVVQQNGRTIVKMTDQPAPPIKGDYSLNGKERSKEEFVYETPHFIVYVIDDREEGGELISCYGVFNKRTGVRETELRREDIAIVFVHALERSLETALKMSAGEEDVEELLGAVEASTVAH